MRKSVGIAPNLVMGMAGVVGTGACCRSASGDSVVFGAADESFDAAVQKATVDDAANEPSVAGPGEPNAHQAVEPPRASDDWTGDFDGDGQGAQGRWQ